MIRIRCSYLEEYRRVVETEWGHEDQLARAIRGDPDAPSWQMECGSAWHALLSAPDLPSRLIGCDLEYRLASGGYRFQVQTVLQGLEHIGLGMWEVPGRMEILPGVSLEGKADHLRGLVIQDQKTKFSPADAKDYEPSMQWRAYLVIHRCQCFRYNLWSFADPDKDGYCEFKNVLSFKFWRYAGLEDEVRAMVRRFLDWSDGRGLLRHLERDPYAHERQAA